VANCGDLQISDFAPHLAEAFRLLNLEWLEKYFCVEAIDRLVLADPQAAIIDPGGQILFAMMNDEAIGTVALKSQGAGTFELTKMAVTAGYQGQGAGRALLLAAIEAFGAMFGKKLYLETHSSLTKAIALYESAGFVHSAPPKPSDYARSDTYMIYRPNSKLLKNK
jgi:ribosomal protein S18 acetylase RimI-like enzyme